MMEWIWKTKNLLNTKACEHDWVVVERVPLEQILATLPNVTEVQVDFGYYDSVALKYFDQYQYHSIKDTFHINNIVCIKCGECEDHESLARELWRKKIHDEWERGELDKQRTALAKKMWRNCNE